MLVAVGRLMINASGWFLRSRRLHDDMAATIAQFAPGIAAIADRVSEMVQGAARDDIAQRAATFAAEGVPEPLARRIASIDALTGALDIVEIASSLGHEVLDIAAVYYQLGGRLGLDGIARRVETLPAEGHWQTLAKNALRDDLAELQRILTRDVAALAPAGDPAQRIATWEKGNASARARASTVVQDVSGSTVPDLAMLSVALRELRNLATNGPEARAAADVGTG
jgi:glutamate dehydrogenase